MRILPHLPLVCCLLLPCCSGSTQPSNNAASPAASSTSHPSPTIDSLANSDSSINSVTALPDENDGGLQADFSGTAGVTEKKNDKTGAALLNAVRIGQQKNFERVVFQFAGSELPGYHIEYIDKPVRSCGSGDVVPLAGDGWLEIRFYPANAHTDEGKPTTARAYSPNYKIVKELRSTCDFEADVTWVVGVASPNRYRVLELKDPTRLVVDIKH